VIKKEPFTLCRIEHNERTYWYVLFYDRETGKRMTKKSVEKLRRQIGDYSVDPILKKEEAIRVCQKFIDTQKGIQKKESDLLLSSYVLTFFDWEKSPYIQRRIALDPHCLSKDYMATRKNLILNHIIPLIPPSTLLKDVSLRMLEDIQLSLVKLGTIGKSTINIAMQAFLLSLREAQHRQLIASSISLDLDMLKAKPRLRGVLSEEEVSRFFQYAKKENNRRIYLSCLLSLLTGMRSGELRALTTDQIQDGLLIVSKAYGDKEGVKAPKGKKSRIIPFPKSYCDELMAFAHTNPYRCKESLVFYSAKGGGHVSSHYFCEKFHASLIASGVLTKEEIEGRNITFHSWRHLANTLLRGSVDEYVLRLAIGHSSEQLSDLYTHLSQKGIKSIENAQQNNILPLLETKK